MKPHVGLPKVVAALAFSVAVLLSGCQTTGPEGSSGMNATGTDSKPALLKTSHLNIPELLQGIYVKVEKQVLDNRIYIQRIWLDGKKGQAFVQSLDPGGWFPADVKRKIDDPEEVEKIARKSHVSPIPSPTRIRHVSKKAGGWYVSYPGRTAGENCIEGAGGYVFRENRYDNDDGTNYDTTIFVHYCGPEGSVRKIEAMLGETVPR